MLAKWSFCLSSTENCLPIKFHPATVGSDKKLKGDLSSPRLFVDSRTNILPHFESKSECLEKAVNFMVFMAFEEDAGVVE